MKSWRAGRSRCRWPEGHQPLRRLDRRDTDAVWLVRDAWLDRLMVAKPLPRHPDAVAAIAALAKVDHPAVARIYGAQERGRNRWLLTEYIEGKSLEQSQALWPARGVVPLLKDLVTACLTLADVGVVHGDIAPDNIIVDARGRGRLIDFGIAGRVGQPASGAGTPGFAAPEVVHREPLSAGTDLWSVAAVGAWLLTGEAPCRDSDGRLSLQVHGAVCQAGDVLASGLWRLLMTVLCADRETRPAVSDWLTALQTLGRAVGGGDRHWLQCWQRD